MSQFKPKKLNIDAIHGGQKYPEARSPFLPSDANEIIEALYGVYEGVEKSAKRAYILTSGNSLIDISIKNNQVIIPRNTLIFGDNFLVSAPSITYLELTDNIKTLRFGVVYYVKEAKKFEITDYYETNNTYDNLYLFSFNFAGDNVVTDLPFEHLVNGEKKGGSGETPAIDASKTKKIYSVGEDYINISKVDDAVIIPVDTIFGEDIEFGNIIEFPFDEYLQEEGTYSLAVVFDRYIEDVEGGAIKFVNPIEILETPNYEWLFTLYFNGREFIHCDIDAPYYINGSLPTGSSVEIEQETGTRTDAVMSQNAITSALSTKLDARKNSNKEYPELYQVSTKGEQGSRVLQSIWQDDETVLVGYSAVQRDQYGCVQVGTPRKGVDAVNKKYADETFIHKLYLHNIVVAGQGADNDDYMKSFTMSFSYLSSKSTPITNYFSVYQGLATITNQSICFCPTQGSTEGATITRCTLLQSGWLFECGYEGNIEETHYISFNDTSTAEANGRIDDTVVQIL